MSTINNEWGIKEGRQKNKKKENSTLWRAAGMRQARAFGIINLITDLISVYDHLFEFAQKPIPHILSDTRYSDVF